MQNRIQDDQFSESSGRTPDPYQRIGNNKSLMDILLSDRSSKSNLIWATDYYEFQGPGYGARDPIQYLYIINPDKVIRPRYMKSVSEKRNRSREVAEVFTPSWIVNKQNNLVDEQWIGRKDVFNIEEGNTWIPTDHIDMGDRRWEDYVKSTRLEVSCGEAPYLTTRYDPVTGEDIPVGYRVGILDRKFRVISENVDQPLVWIEWAKVAVESTYAYDLQGDNVLLARENMLIAFAESYMSKFGEEPGQDAMEDIAYILSWNVWQMDGMKLVVPFSCDKVCRLDEDLSIVNNCPACKSGNGKHTGTNCKIMDWEMDRTIEFASMIKKDRPRPKNTGMRTLESFGE